MHVYARYVLFSQTSIPATEENQWSLLLGLSKMAVHQMTAIQGDNLALPLH